MTRAQRLTRTGLYLFLLFFFSTILTVPAYQVLVDGNGLPMTGCAVAALIFAAGAVFFFNQADRINERDADLGR